MEIAWLEIADDPELWRRVGFTVDDEGRCVIGGVEHRLVGTSDESGRRGVIGWAISGVDPDTAEIDGIATQVVDSHTTPSTPEHPNHVFRIDHLVLHTTDTPRTAAALESVGLTRRGSRATNSAGDAVDMTFFWAGDVLLEIAGPPTPRPDPKPARLSGIAYSSADLDATVAMLGDRCTIPVDAVQKGRRISALTKEAGSSMPMAFMTPHVRAN